MKRLLKTAKTISPFKAGMIGVIVIIAVCYGAYTKFANPFASKFTIHAIVANANGLRPQSAVRISGVNVGTVTSISPVAGCKIAVSSGPESQCSAADVTMQIESSGLPIHKDANFWIRPRIFLEGNFFVDVEPGTPESPVAPNGFVFPIQQTREPVQFGQVLTSLQTNTRSNLQTLVQQYGLAVYQSAADFNDSINYWTPAYKWGSAVAHDTLGEQPNDLSGWINKAGVVNGALSAHPENLKNLITDLNTTALAFARENTALENAVAELPTTLQTAIPAEDALETAFCSGPQVPNCSPGPLPQFARALIPAAKSTPSLVDNSLPFFHQLRLLVSPPELLGLTNDLSHTIPALSKLDAESVPFMKNEVRPASNCQLKVVLPWSKLTINDSHFNSSNGFPARPVYVEGVDYLPGLAGESRDFDANGPYVRVLGTGGTATYSLSPGLFGTSLQPIEGVQPATPALHDSGDGATVAVSRPPLKEYTPCETQRPITETELNDVTQGPTPKAVTTSSNPVSTALTNSSAALELAQLVPEAREQGMSIRMPSRLAHLVAAK